MNSVNIVTSEDSSWGSVKLFIAYEGKENKENLLLEQKT